LLIAFIIVLLFLATDFFRIDLFETKTINKNEGMQNGLITTNENAEEEHTDKKISSK
jgi:hypothetical protein